MFGKIRSFIIKTAEKELNKKLKKLLKKKLGVTELPEKVTAVLNKIHLNTDGHIKREDLKMILYDVIDTNHDDHIDHKDAINIFFNVLFALVFK